MSKDTAPIRTEIMDMLRKKFSGLALWPRLESPLAIACADLPEPYNKENQVDFIKKLKSLKLFLLEEGIPEEDLHFLEDEIDLHKHTKMVSLYQEEDDLLEPAVIETFARLGKGTEGVVSIPHEFNYTQLSKLTNGVYQRTGLVKFYISKERTLYGKIVAEIYEHAQKIPIATVLESNKLNKETGEPLFKGVKLFGERFTRKEYNIIKEINIPFYVYRFITQENDELILITLTQCEIGDYIIMGVQTQCDDYKMLSESARLPTKLPFFFAQKLRSRIIKYKNHEEFRVKLVKLNITKENFFDYPFCITKDQTTWKLIHPNWYKWLLWSWLTHQKKGLVNKYPLHLMIIGVPGAGKSFLLNSLFNKSKETREVFSGASSTLKSLVPSFKYSPAKLGYLAESNRMAFCDEFLRCLTNTRTTKDGSAREESVAMMNDLLEHQKREAGSGVSRVKVNMTARVLAATNPIHGINNVDDLVKTYDASFLSRWLIYYQTEEHAKLVKNSDDSRLEEYNFSIDDNDWISILDYLQTFSSEYDMSKVEAIRNSVPNILSENLKKHYDTRHKHHIECLMDGIVKARCVFEQDMNFRATSKDYDVLEEVWAHVIKSWINPQQVRNIDIKERIKYLPENCQFLFHVICEEKRPVSKEQLDLLMQASLSKPAYYEAFNILVSMSLINESDGFIRPYYMSDLRKDGML